MNDKQYLELAVNQASNSLQMGGFPAGAIVVKGNKVVSRGVSLGFKLNDPTSHAETSAIRNACQALKTTDLEGATLYASLQPCLMCFCVANWANISKIVYGCKKTKEMVNKGYYEGKTDIYKINKQNNNQVELIYLPNLEATSLALVKKWEKSRLKKVSQV